MQQCSLFDGAFRQQVVQIAVSPHQQAVDAWHQLWLETRGEVWAWAPRDHKAVKDCLKFRTAGCARLFASRAAILLETPPTLWLAQNASPQVLYTHWYSLSTKVTELSRSERGLREYLAALEAL